MSKDTIIQQCDFRMHDVIDGKYKVVRVLASSAADQKFKVVDSEGKEFILKLLKLWEVSPEIRKNVELSYENEIRSCLIKSHYLTRIVGTGIVKGNPYLLIEYCKATDLSHFIGKNGLNVVKIAKQILYGLRDLHKSGKVHCRLTPENILLTEDGDVLLTNYLISGDRGMNISSSQYLHSRFVDKDLAYRAPELYRLERSSSILPTVDIFSFGVILFQMLTASLPYGKLITEADWIHYQSRVIGNDWNKGILPRNSEYEMWMKILESCLLCNPEHRQDNIDELLRLLPVDTTQYISLPGNRINVPDSFVNGIMLHVMQGDDFDNCYRLNELIQFPKRLVTVGRTNEDVFNTIQLNEKISTYISRKHCTLEYDNENEIWYIRDGQWNKEGENHWSDSLNGTYLNSDTVTSEGCPLSIGDIISIGDVKLRVEGY